MFYEREPLCRTTLMYECHVLERSPYIPPRTDAPPPRQEPVLSIRRFRVLGVLSLAFGAITLAMSAWNLAAPDPLNTALADLLRQLPTSVDWSRELAPVFRRVNAANFTQWLVYVVMSAALIPLGFGQFGVRRWARLPTIAWAALAMLVCGVCVYLQLTVQTPGLHTIVVYLRNALPTGIPPEQQAVIRLYEVLLQLWWLTVLIYVPYPVVLLGICGHGSARRAMCK